MNFTTAEISAWIGAWLWPLFRIGAMLTAAPIFGTRTVPVRVRLGIALAITLVLAPLAGPVPGVDPLSAPGALITVHQVLIGVAMGFVLRMVFAVFEIVGEAIGMLMGLGFASMVDPQNGVQVPVVSHFYLLLATLMFLALNGHLLWIEVLAESFRVLPVGAAGLSVDAAWSLVGFAGLLFEWAVRMALPVVAALLVVNLAFGVLTRASPQLNVFSVGFPATLLLGFVLILVTLPGVMNKVMPLSSDGLNGVGRVLGVGG